MPKTISDPIFVNAVKDWQANKREMDRLKDVNKQIEDYILQHFSDVDLTSDAKGTERLLSDDGKFGFVIEHKVTVGVDMKQARAMLETTGQVPEHFFNVKYDFSQTINKSLSEEDQQWLNGCLTYKRAKSSFKPEIKEN